MERGRSSETAVLAALSRAAHCILDSKPWILQDEFAARLANIQNEASLRSAFNAWRDELERISSAQTAADWIQATRVITTLRARHAEDELERAIERGVSQYVILGAGFDSFAYRRQDLLGKLRVFEVDYPTTQATKRARLEEVGMVLPEHVSFVPVDFEEQSILSALELSGYSRDKPAFFAWLGVTWYLTEAAIAATLKQVCAAADGSEIVFEYVVPKEMLDTRDRRMLELLESLAARRGEPGRSCFAPEHIRRIVRESGFAHISDFTPGEANAQYLVGRADGLRFPGLMHFIKARVDRAGQLP